MFSRMDLQSQGRAYTQDREKEVEARKDQIFVIHRPTGWIFVGCLGGKGVSGIEVECLWVLISVNC